MKPDNYLEPIVTAFENNSDPTNADQMAVYMKNRFEFFGIKSPLRKKLTREFIAEHGLPDPDALESVVIELYSRPQRELQYFGNELCGRMRQTWTQQSIELFEYMATTKPWWDSVDSVNLNCVKFFFLRFPGLASSRTQRWIETGNIWLQRLSLIFQLRYKTSTDTRLLKRNIDMLKNSEEFFVQKAIGWILRDYSETDPDWVRNVVSKLKLKPLSRREALKRLEN